VAEARAVTTSVGKSTPPRRVGVAEVLTSQAAARLRGAVSVQ
jgi:hypothetical protein